MTLQGEPARAATTWSNTYDMVLSVNAFGQAVLIGSAVAGTAITGGTGIAPMAASVGIVSNKLQALVTRAPPPRPIGARRLKSFSRSPDHDDHRLGSIWQDRGRAAVEDLSVAMAVDPNTVTTTTHTVNDAIVATDTVANGFASGTLSAPANVGSQGITYQSQTPVVCSVDPSGRVAKISNGTCLILVQSKKDSLVFNSPSAERLWSARDYSSMWPGHSLHATYPMRWPPSSQARHRAICDAAELLDVQR